MARATRLKVYRTVAGFADAYVAAPSQKAALEAWGSGKDLFARGLAEIVTDPALTAAPLASPGIVVRRSRGTAAEQLAALPADTPRPAPPAPLPPKRGPRPDRTDLDAAEAAIGQAERAGRDAMKALADREAALARDRRTAEREQHDRMQAAEGQRDERRIAYDAAMTRWRQGTG